MALIICSDCGRNVSDKASVCPNCGYPIGEPMINRFQQKRKPRYAIKIIICIACITVSLLVAIVYILLNGKPIGMDKTTYRLGVEAVQAIDQYLDLEIDGSDAGKKLKNISNRLDVICENSTYSDELLLSYDTSNVSTYIALEGLDFSDGMYDSLILEARNKIADTVNKKERSK